MAKVSIIVPTYNVENYLVECMESLVNQTLTDIEIICINDGSTDGSLEILKAYAQKDSRIVLIDKENGGYGIGMNIGLDKASGQYIGIVEPDDFVPINMYQDLYNKASENDLDFVKADFYRFKRSDNGDMELAYNHLSINPEDYNVIFDPSKNPDALRFIMNTWSGIYKRDFLEKHNIRHNETPGASFQDNGFWFQTFIFAQRAMILDRPYYMNRRDNPNSSVHNKDKVYCMNVEYDHIRDILSRDEELWNRFKGLYWFKKYNNYWGTVKRIGEEHRKEYVMRFSQEFKRGLEKNELEEEVFTPTAWSNIQFLVKDPEGFYTRKVVMGLADGNSNFNYQKTLNELNRLKNSNSYKIGRALTCIPRKIKASLKKA
ncbi:Chondroitin polymerase [uncultured Roseburia sp.]|uniref:Glycosyltransferase n=1 Tax=Brotonthovivens ammoniilytica TaxID=2981725 RepID=A0ABT2TKF5_9FIRM|nr:glycosyltransferase [Brotonthovivens ammoniilytica]MCU6762675.1 glycosyltransferase [Brotonthovivens ammoniilytica]SCI84343.1 Chondroitin polymerase [uncultured Roseburia sp.]